ncbi:MAG: 50S ribosomal protein L29 [Rhodospirillales bacterium]|nr:50S ribosomal protein L29 [Rhodospirillales bacterium]
MKAPYTKEDLKTKTPDELKKLLLAQKKAQFNMRFQKTNGVLENTSEIRKTRRTVARIKTFLNAQNTNKPEDKAAPKKAPAKKAPGKKSSKKAA